MPLTHGSHSSRPVFVDPSGRRRRQVRAAILLAWIGLILFLVAYVWALGTEPVVDQWRLGGSAVVLPLEPDGPAR